MRDWLFPDRTTLVCAVVSVAAALVCCLLPLFNLLGYESSAVLGVLAGLGALFTTSAAIDARAFSPLAVDSERPLVWFTELYARNLLTLLVPALGVLTLHMIRVPNCDPLLGLAFWGVIPTGSVLIGQSLAWGLSAVSSRHRVRLGLGLAACVANGLALGVHLASEPPIIGHQWLIGFFSGSIYDEALSMPASLLWYRLTHVCWATSMVLGLEVARRVRSARRIGHVASWATVATIAAGCCTAAEQSFGVRLDRALIAEELGGVVETEHFVIYYPATRHFSGHLDELVEDHEFRYAEMRAFFGTDPVASSGGEKVRSFVYADREQKGQLMGARRTLVAKIWLGEIHIMWRGLGDHLLAHELAHVFTRPFGAGPLALSMQNGVGVNMGLVEGIATAADWPAGELTPHEAARAMRDKKLAPDIRRLVGAGGFWTQASGKAYTLMGSFVRFLVDTRGIEPFKRVYADGDFEAAYGVPASELVAQWEEFVDALALTERQRALATYRYTRPSIFGKVCARTLAELRRQASIAAASGSAQRADALYQRILDFAPGHVGYRIERAGVLVRAGALKEARGALDELASDERLSPAERARVAQLAGDAAWRSGEADEAASSYSSCLKLGVPDGDLRLLTVKLESLARPPEVASLARAYLVEGPPAGMLSYYPMAWLDEDAADPLAAYLTARRLWSEREWALAMPYIERALKLSERSKTEVLGWEALYMKAYAALRLGRLDVSERAYAEVAAGAPSRLATLAEEGGARVEWRRAWRGSAE